MFTAGITLRDDIPTLSHWFYMGGQSYFTYLDGFIPFTGLKFIEQAGLYSSLQVAWQYQIMPKFYLTPKIDLGVITADWETMTSNPELLVGYGLTLGYDSFVGPVELTLMGSNRTKGVGNFINIGYWF